MPLHPQAQAFLEAFEQADAALPPLEQRDAAAWREQGRALAAEARDAPLGPPVHSEVDRTIPGPAGEIPVRVLTPGTGGPYPLLVWFHGGGWVLGGLDGGIHSLRLLANVAECVIVSVDYRLAPEHRFPAALDDCLAATSWAAEHAAELNADPARIAVGGDSAGGTLAAVVAQQARDAGGPELAFQLLVYPVTDCDLDRPSYRANGEGYLLTREWMRWFWEQYMGSDGDWADPRASPMRAASLDGLPPAHVVVAEFDPLLDEGVAYARALEAAGADVTLVQASGQLHGFWGTLGIIDEAERAVAEAARSMTRAFQAR
jgi:acetyl esterase